MSSEITKMSLTKKQLTARERTLGVALFSMFLGAGNMIFPLAIGARDPRALVPHFLGFACSAVLLPLAAIFILMHFSGRYEEVFAALGRRGRWVFPAAILAAWIPLGSGPRCIQLAYAGMVGGGSSADLFGFTVLYSVGVVLCCGRAQMLVTVLGKVIGPLLLGCLVLLYGVAVFQSPGSTSAGGDAGVGAAWASGFRNGVKTQDFLAAFFFGRFIFEQFADLPPAQRRISTIRACRSAFVLMGVTYLVMISVGSMYAPVLAGKPGDQLLPSVLAQLPLGPYLARYGSAVLIFLSCFSTSVALTAVFAQQTPRVVRGLWRGRDQQESVAGAHSGWSMLGSAALIAVLAPFGFATVDRWVQLLMGVLYPLLGVGSVVALGHSQYQKSRTSLGDALVSSAGRSLSSSSSSSSGE